MLIRGPLKTVTMEYNKREYNKGFRRTGVVARFRAIRLAKLAVGEGANGDAT